MNFEYDTANLENDFNLYNCAYDHWILTPLLDVVAKKFFCAAEKNPEKYGMTDFQKDHFAGPVGCYWGVIDQKLAHIIPVGHNITAELKGIKERIWKINRICFLGNGVPVATKLIDTFKQFVYEQKPQLEELLKTAAKDITGKDSYLIYKEYVDYYSTLLNKE